MTKESLTWAGAKKAVEEKKPERKPPSFEPIQKIAKRKGWKIGVWGLPATLSMG